MLSGFQVQARRVVCVTVGTEATAQASHWLQELEPEYSQRRKGTFMKGYRVQQHVPPTRTFGN